MLLKLHTLLMLCFQIETTGSDVESLIQQTFQASQQSDPPAALHAVAGEEEGELAELQEAMERGLPLAMQQAGTEATADAMRAQLVREAEKEVKGHEQRLKAVWEELLDHVDASSGEKPQDLLEQIKAHLLRTKGLDELVKASQRVLRAMDTLRENDGAIQSLLPYDSAVFGYEASLAPWSRFLSETGLPAVQGKGKLFANVKFDTSKLKPTLSNLSSDVRICLSTNTRDANASGSLDFVTYFEGIAKWDKLLGKSFGVGKVYENELASDFGWKWTSTGGLPEPVCLFFDICVLNADDVHPSASASALQTEMQVGVAEELGNQQLPSPHRIQFTEQTWCTPTFDMR
mmetsp:Transcript_132240/g.368641  ORF Transcript_132240/g.368641 Transcript_132240/m.368641 type:complete len:346 (+) Transcript_132240:82-1119(+)